MVGSNICYLSDTFLDQHGQTWSSWWHVANRSHDWFQNCKGIWQTPTYLNVLLCPHGFLCGLDSSEVVHLEASTLFSSYIFKLQVHFYSFLLSCTKKKYLGWYWLVYVVVWGALKFWLLVVLFIVAFSIWPPSESRWQPVFYSKQNKSLPHWSEGGILLLALGWSGFLSNIVPWLILFILFQHQPVIKVVEGG